MNSATSTDPGLRPWQLFLLAGMLAATAVVLLSTGQTMAGVVVLSLTVVASSLVAMAGYRSLAPLTAAEDEVASAPVGGRARLALEREKALLLRTIKELEFDHAMGKTTTAEFEEMRDRLKLRAVGLMRRLEGTNFAAAVERDLEARSAAVERDLEARSGAVPAALARDAAQAPTRAGATAQTAPDAATSAADLESRASACPACGTANDADARFCKHCGAAVGGATA